MAKQGKHQNHKNILRNINFAIMFLTFALNVILFYSINNNKPLFLTISIIVNIYLFLLHWFILIKTTKYKLNDIKKEAANTNYVSMIITFVLCIISALVISSLLLFFVSKEAFNITLIFLFFLSILTMLSPSIILLAYIYFIVPSLIIPGLTIKKYHEANSMSLLFIIFMLISALCICKYAMSYLYENNFLTQIKYRVEKMSVEYSNKFLNISEELTPTELRDIKNIKLDIPYLYTKEGFFYRDYNDAKMFCDSMDARLPNHLEIYNIIFNQFNIFGESYYWTSTNEDKEPLLIHFKNMSYTLEHNNNNISPIVYCVSDVTEYEKERPKLTRKYFIKNVNKKIKHEYSYNTRTQEEQAELDLLAKINQSGNNETNNNENNTQFHPDMKYINFSIKEVSKDTMKSLMDKGYIYYPNFTIGKEHKINPEEISTKVEKDPNKKSIRLCYYPFIDYSNMTLDEEAQLWQQSFCSPSFELIQYYPQTTSVYDKDTYCSSMGGRLPNIPELMGILKTYSKGKTGIKYWTNNVVNQSSTGVSYPILVYFKDSRFLIPTMAEKSNIAYTYCIKDSKTPSKLITNYASRFKGLNGKQFAKSKCPDCNYQEVPDTILLQNN